MEDYPRNTRAGWYPCLVNFMVSSFVFFRIFRSSKSSQRDLCHIISKSSNDPFILPGSPRHSIQFCSRLLKIQFFKYGNLFSILVSPLKFFKLRYRKGNTEYRKYSHLNFSETFGATLKCLVKLFQITYQSPILFIINYRNNQ